MLHRRYRMENKHEKIPNFLEVNLYLSNELAIVLQSMSSYTYKNTFTDSHVIFTFESQQLENPQVYQQLNGYTLFLRR